MLQIPSKRSDFCSKILQTACTWKILLQNVANLILSSKRQHIARKYPRLKNKNDNLEKQQEFGPICDSSLHICNDTRLKMLESHAKHIDRYLNSSTRAVFSLHTHPTKDHVMSWGVGKLLFPLQLAILRVYILVVRVVYIYIWIKSSFLDGFIMLDG